MDWAPTLADREGPLYQRIVDALSADIASGRLRRGQQLPTHRALAKALGIDLTTVTRAYAEARQRGLTEARVGRGTFVCESMSPARHAVAPQPQFDLSMNLPPQPLEADLEGRITRGIAAIQREAGFSAHLNYREPGGSESERDIAAQWLRLRIADARGDRLVICPGTQNALFNRAGRADLAGRRRAHGGPHLSRHQGGGRPYWCAPSIRRVGSMHPRRST
jgi:DNA-binding transcriptional MocR family regulator